LYTVAVLTISDLNALVLDYLLVEGFSDAAISFAKETGLSVDIDSQAIQQRMIIKEAVEDGRVEDAVRRVNELDPEVCLPSLHFQHTDVCPNDSNIMHHA
jgi:molybdopterin-guanine dinucleotide biosynthesis protein